MLKLFQFHSAFGVRNLSPFCLKLETYLRLTGIEYEVAWSNTAIKAPKGKLPYIIDEGYVLGDSALIIDYLKKKHGDPLDGKLSADQKAQILAWRSLFEDSLIFAMIYSRWIDPAGWHKMQTLFASLPLPLRLVIPGFARNKISKQLFVQGMGRHTQEEVYDFGLHYLSAIETFLGNKPFMLGDTPTSLDATAYGILTNFVDTDFDNPLNRKAKATPSFVAYCERMKQRCFADLA